MSVLKMHQQLKKIIRMTNSLHSKLIKIIQCQIICLENCHILW
jgi:hypothetical protein